MRSLLIFVVLLTSGSIARAQCPATGTAGDLLYYNSSGNCSGTGALTIGNLSGTPNISPQTYINLPGGAWGSGALAGNTAPITQNVIFTGSTTGAQASFGAFLQQTDESSNTGNGIGLFEILNLNSSNVVGGREGGEFDLKVNHATGNTNAPIYTGLTGKCYMSATDSTTGSSCFGGNFVAALGNTTNTNVAASSNVGLEIDTWEQSASSLQYRIGMQIVETVGSYGTYGTQASIDDVALSLNNQYGPSATNGFKVGLEFGRNGGNFPVYTGGTLIKGTGPTGRTSWTVANGIDWSLGTATSNWVQYGSVYKIDGSGNETANTLTVAKLASAPTTAPGAGKLILFAVAGTTSGTCKLQAMAGTSTTPTTVVDNVGSGC